MRRALLIALLAIASPARAYVSTKTQSDTPVHWPMRCIVMQPDARGDENDEEIDADTIATTLDAATGAWNDLLGTCTYMTFGTVPATHILDAVSDGRPAVVFRSDFWGRNGMPHDASAIGVTTVWFADRPHDYTDGQITDADIELNAVNFTFTTQPMTAGARQGTKVADLQNTLTHELGHVLGLAHTCWDHVHPDGTEDVQPTDNTGALVPDCSSGNLPPKVTQATMYPFAPERGTTMRIVGDDDLQGVCDNYPMTDTPPACYGFIETNGCTMQGRAAGRSIVVACLLLCAALVVHHRRRRGIL